MLAVVIALSNLCNVNMYTFESSDPGFAINLQQGLEKNSFGIML
jgi:hypothetical protein